MLRSVEDVLRQRLANQQLAGPAACWPGAPADSAVIEPGALVAHFGAVQAQDYPAALWALGQRLPGSTEASLERAFADGAILRTHVLRPTWHFVAPSDIRWLLALSAPRVRQAMASADRALGLDAAFVARSNAGLARALEGGRHLGRTALGQALRQAGLDVPDGRRLAHLMLRAELDGVLCSGPRLGKQLTYALLDERVPAGRPFEREVALAELVRRYVTSHGPATVRDCVWWSGLTAADVRRGLELGAAHLSSQSVEGLTYWFAPPAAPPPASAGDVHLLPNYDEYTVAYRDRDALYDPSAARPGFATTPREDVPFGNVIVLDGRVAGVWKRTRRQDRLVLETRWFTEPTTDQQAAVASATGRYAMFLGLPSAACEARAASS